MPLLRKLNIYLDLFCWNSSKGMFFLSYGAVNLQDAQIHTVWHPRITTRGFQGKLLIKITYLKRYLYNSCSNAYICNLWFFYVIEIRLASQLKGYYICTQYTFNQ